MIYIIIALQVLLATLCLINQFDYAEWCQRDRLSKHHKRAYNLSLYPLAYNNLDLKRATGLHLGWMKWFILAGIPCIIGVEILWILRNYYL